MVVADDAGDLPGVVFIRPQVDKLAFAKRLCVIVAGVVEEVCSHLNRANAFHGMNLQRAFQKLARDLAADVVFDAFRQLRFAESDAALVVVELDVIGKERGEIRQVAGVVGFKKRRIKSGDDLDQFFLRFDFIEWLRLCQGRGQSEER